MISLSHLTIYDEPRKDRRQCRYLWRIAQKQERGGNAKRIAKEDKFGSRIGSCHFAPPS
jgi:hypothetical protein